MKQKLPLAKKPAEPSEPPSSTDTPSGLLSLESDRTQLKRVPEELLGSIRALEAESHALNVPSLDPPQDKAPAEEHTTVFRPPPELLARARAAANAAKAARVAEPVDPAAQTRETERPAPPTAELLESLADPAAPAAHSSEPSLEIGTHLGRDPNDSLPPFRDSSEFGRASSRPTAPHDEAPQRATPVESLAAAQAEAKATPQAPRGARELGPSAYPEPSGRINWILALVLGSGVAFAIWQMLQARGPQ